jgi:hypothetical protein
MVIKKRSGSSFDQHSIKVFIMATQLKSTPLAFVDYIFGMQGVLLLVNCAYLLQCPEAAATPPSILEGATPAIFHTLM